MAGEKVGEAYVELQARMGKFEAQLRSAKMLTGTATAKMQTGMNNVAMATKKTSAAMKLLKVAIGAISFIAVIMAFKKIVQATAQFEDAQLELRKTSGMTRAEIDKFSGRMKNMAAVMPTSTTGLLEIAAAAARLGIQGSDNLADFSETVIKMATATQYTEEQASLDFAKIATVMKLPYKEIGRLGSAMNELANTTTATAPIIGDFTRRVAGAGSTLGLTIPQLTAMGATLDSLGVTTQVSGTAMSNFFTKMLTKAKTFADQAGMAVEDWNRLVEVDAYEALQKWLSAMDKMKPIERAAALGELKMAGARMTDTLMKLSGAQELLNENLATAEEAFRENTSLEKEYQIALEGLSAQWNIFTGNVVNLAIAIGTKLSPALKQIMSGLNVVVDGLQFMINNWSQVWKAAYQILIQTFKQMGKTIWKFFTDWSVFKAGLNLFYQFEKALIMTWARTWEMLGKLVARVTSIIWAPLMKSLQWVGENIAYYFNLGMQLARNAVFKGINVIGSTLAKGLNKVFGPIFKKMGIDMEKALTFEIPEITLQQPKKFTERMSEAWDIIKDQYSKIPGDLKKYVDDLTVEWENVSKAAGEFGEAVDWTDYTKKLGEIIEKLKAAGIATAALEKEQEKLNEELDKTKDKLDEATEALKDWNLIMIDANKNLATGHVGFRILGDIVGEFRVEVEKIVKILNTWGLIMADVSAEGYMGFRILGDAVGEFTIKLEKALKVLDSWQLIMSDVTAEGHVGFRILGDAVGTFIVKLEQVVKLLNTWQLVMADVSAEGLVGFRILGDAVGEFRVELEKVVKALGTWQLVMADVTAQGYAGFRILGDVVGTFTMKLEKAIKTAEKATETTKKVAEETKQWVIRWVEYYVKDITGALVKVEFATYEMLKRIAGYWKDATKAMKGTLISFVADIIEGVKTIEDVWADAMSAVRRTFAEALAKSLIEKMGFDVIFKRNLWDLSDTSDEAFAASMANLDDLMARFVEIMRRASELTKKYLGSIEVGGLGANIAVPGLQAGTPYVPRTGLYQLERGEKVTPARGVGMGSGQVGGGNIIIQSGAFPIQFPNVTSFQDWLNAGPGLIKQVTERKILIALKTLAREGKVSKESVMMN